jgi:hypothetical protein
LATDGYMGKGRILSGDRICHYSRLLGRRLADSAFVSEFHFGWGSLSFLGLDCFNGRVLGLCLLSAAIEEGQREKAASEEGGLGCAQSSGHNNLRVA